MQGKTKRIAYAAVAGAAYAALTMLLAPLSYGPLQLRLSEALCVLPFLDPVFAGGLFVGCVIANVMSTGGLLDIVFGSLATLLAALCTAAIGKKSRSLGASALGCLMPVIFNAAIVGAVLAASGMAGGKSFGAAWALYGAQLGASEALVMGCLGLPLLRLLLRRLPEELWKGR